MRQLVADWRIIQILSSPHTGILPALPVTMAALQAVQKVDTSLSIEQRFRDAFVAIQGPWDAARPMLDALYSPDVRFRDAIYRFDGKEALLRGNERIVRAARKIKVNLESVVTQGDELFANWSFHYTPKLGVPITIEGCTHARFRDDQIIYQRDYWDILGSLLGGLARVFRRH